MPASVVTFLVGGIGMMITGKNAVVLAVSTVLDRVRDWWTT